VTSRSFKSGCDCVKAGACDSLSDAPK
jgi:hypothetical protein